MCLPPVSDVVNKLGRVKFKRSPPNVDSPRAKKRSKVDVAAQRNSEPGSGTKKASNKKNNVRRTKNQLRRKLTFNKSQVISSISVPFAQAENQDDHDGAGWPSTALLAP